MEDSETPTTAAERAAATIAAAAEAAAAEEAEAAAEAASDDKYPSILAAPGRGVSYAQGDTAATATAAEAADKQRQRVQRGVTPPAAPHKPFTPTPPPPMHAREAALLSQHHKGAPLSSSSKAPSRACQWLRCLPVVFVMLLVLYLDVVYIAYHCLPHLQLRLPPNRRSLKRFNAGAYEMLVFVLLTFLFVLSYWLAVITPAGSIPKTPEWNLGTDDDASHPFIKGTVETKRGGGRRACKWCKRGKPDRAHHCRVCRKCVLKMDHHCPWIFNCVGFGNHKFFMLTLFWGSILSLFVAITMLPTVKAAIRDDQTSFERVFMLLFAETLDIFLCTLISGFLFFHSYLVAHAVTTIEFCEKQFRRSGVQSVPEVIWSRGFSKNFTDAFGSNPLLWFFPIDNRDGDGTSFECSVPPPYETTEDLEKRLVRGLSASRRYKGFDPVIDSES